MTRFLLAGLVAASLIASCFAQSSAITPTTLRSPPEAEAYGGHVICSSLKDQGADQIQKTIRDCTAHQYTEAAAYRADLSYVPGK